MKQKVKLDKRNNSTVNIEALSHDGRGIGKIDAKTTFVSGALPNELISCQITQKRTKYNDAKLLEVLKSAENRVNPPCRHFGLCGGCSLQHMSMQTQLQLKQETLLNQLKHFGQIEPKNLLAPLTASETQYRRKARLGVKYVIKKEKLMVGFREQSSRYLADLEQCVVLHPAVGEALEDFKNLIMQLNCYQQIPQIEVAIGDVDKALVFRHLTPLTATDLSTLKNFGAKFGFDIYLQPNAPDPVIKIFPEDKFERIKYTLPAFQLEYLFHPLDFTQINLEINRLMVNKAIEFLDIAKHETILDLFCGIGNFTLPIARFAKEVIGVEGSHTMVLRGEENALHNHIHNAAFFAENLETPQKNSFWLQKSYDKILLDPPRVGAKELIPHLAGCAAKKIVYISCNPATLARDAYAFVHDQHYSLSHVGVINMFPHTSHIEAIAIFEK